jgi:hypothetical protein
MADEGEIEDSESEEEIEIVDGVGTQTLPESSDSVDDDVEFVSQERFAAMQNDINTKKNGNGKNAKFTPYVFTEVLTAFTKSQK